MHPSNLFPCASSCTELSLPWRVLRTRPLWEGDARNLVPLSHHLWTSMPGASVSTMNQGAGVHEQDEMERWAFAGNSRLQKLGRGWSRYGILEIRERTRSCTGTGFSLSEHSRFELPQVLEARPHGTRAAPSCEPGFQFQTCSSMERPALQRAAIWTRPRRPRGPPRGV